MGNDRWKGLSLVVIFALSLSSLAHAGWLLVFSDVDEHHEQDIDRGGSCFSAAWVRACDDASGSGNAYSETPFCATGSSAGTSGSIIEVWVFHPPGVGEIEFSGRASAKVKGRVTSGNASISLKTKARAEVNAFFAEAIAEGAATSSGSTGRAFAISVNPDKRARVEVNSGLLDPFRNDSKSFVFSDSEVFGGIECTNMVTIRMESEAFVDVYASTSLIYPGMSSGFLSAQSGTQLTLIEHEDECPR